MTSTSITSTSITTYGPREVAELMTFSETRRAGISSVTYQMSLRRKLRDADARQRARFIATTL